MADQAPWEKYAPAPSKTEDGPWAKYAQSPSTEDTQTTSLETPPADDGAGWALARSAARAVVPGIVGTATAIPAAAAGTFVGGPVGTAVGGVGGAIAGSTAAETAQTALADKYAPDSWFGSKSAEADAKNHPVASTVGGLLGFGKPSLKAPLAAGEALLTQEGRQGLSLAAKNAIPFTKSAKEFAQKAAVAGSEEAKASEAFGHVVGSAAGVGVGTAQGIMQGADPLTAAGHGALGLAFEPWVGPHTFLGQGKKANPIDDLANKKSTQNVDSSKAASETELAPEDNAEESADFTPTPEVKAAAEAIENGTLVQNLVESDSPATAEVVASQNATKKEEDEATLSKTGDQFEKKDQPVINLPALDGSQVSSTASNKEESTPPLVSSADEQNPQDASAATEPPVASQIVRTPEQYLDNRGGLGRLRLNDRLPPSDKYPQGQPSLSELLHVAVRDQDAESLQWIHNEMQQRMAKPSFQKEQMLLQARNAIVRLTGQEPVAPTLKVSGENNAPKVIKGGPEITNPALKVAAARALSPEQNPPAVNQVEIRQPEVTEPTGTEHLNEVEPDTEDQMPDPLPAEEGDEQGEKEFIDSVNEQYPGQYTHDILQSLYRAKDSDQFTQWATTHYPDIAKNPAIAKSLYSEFWDVSSSSTQPAPKRIDASDAAHAKANELGIDIVEVTPSNGTRITVNDVKEHFKDLEKNQAEPESYDDEDEQDFEDLESQGETPKAKPNFWFRTPEAEAFLKDLLDQREKAASDNPAISEPAKARLAELQLQARENPNLLLNDVVDLNDAHAKSFDFAGVPDEYESIPLTGAEWTDETIEPRGDKSLRRVVLPDGRITFVDLNSIPEGLRDYLDQNTPPFDKKPSITKLSKLLGVSRNAITGQKTSEGHKPGFIDYGMPTGSEKAAKAWYSKYVTDKRFNSETNRAYNNRTSLDREIGEGGTASVQDLVGDGDSSDLNIGGNIAQNSEVRVESITDRALAHMDRKDVPLSRRIAVGQKILEGAESLGLSDEELIPITAKLKKLESQPNYAESKKEAESLIKQNNFDAEQLMDNVDGNGKFDVNPLRAIDAGLQGDRATETRGEPIRTIHAGDLLTQVQQSRDASTFARVVAGFLNRSRARLEKIPTDIYNTLEDGRVGEYDRATKRIGLPEDFDPDVALHEILHALTQGGGFHSAEIKRLFIKIRNEAVKRGITSEEQWTRAADPTTALNATDEDIFHYAFSSPDELIAGMLHPQVREVLNSIPIRDGITGKLSNAWERLKARFLEALGFRVKPGSALDKYLTHVMELAAPGSEAGDKDYYTTDSHSTLDTEGGNSVLYSNAKATDQSQSSTEEQPKIGFLYTKGGLNTESPYRGSESLRLLTEAIASNTGGDEGAGGKNGELGDSFKRLREVVDKAGLNIAAPFFKRVANPRTEVGEPGAEHSVYGDPRTNRVIKLTHADQDGDGIVGAKGSANNYFTSQLLVKEILGMDTQFEGLVDLGGKLPQVVTSQPWVKGDNATISEIQADLKARGFTKKIARKDVNIWTNKTLGVDIYDARPANVLKDSEGNLNYIDVDMIPNRPVADILADIQKAREEGEKTGKLGAIRKATTAGQNDRDREIDPTRPQPMMTSVSNAETTDKMASYINSFKNTDEAYDALLNLSKDPTLARSMGIDDNEVQNGLKQLQKRYQNQEFTLKQKANPTPEDLVNIQTAKARNAEITDRYKGNLSMGAKVTQEGANIKSIEKTPQDFVDAYQQATLGGKLTDLGNGKLNIADLVQGIKEIKRNAAETAVDAAGKVLEKFGITDSTMLSQLKTILGGVDTTRAQLKSALAYMMTGATPESVEAATQQLTYLYNQAAQKIARTELPKEVHAAYTGSMASKIVPMTEKLGKYISLGKFNEDQIHQTLLESLGLQGYNADFVSKIREAASFIQTLPEGHEVRNDALTMLNGTIANEILAQKIKAGGWSATKAVLGTILPDLFRSAILTGPQTFLTHGFSGFLNVRLQGGFNAFGHFLSSVRSGNSVNDSFGYIKDFLDTAIGSDKGARNKPLASEFNRAWRTGKISQGLADGIGKRGADLLASLDLKSDNIDGKIGNKALNLYSSALGFLPRFMMAFDAINAGTASEMQQRWAMRAALLNGGLKSEEIATAMQKQFAPTTEDLKPAYDKLEEEVNQGFFNGVTGYEKKAMLAARLEQIQKENLPPAALGMAKDISKNTKDWTLKGDAKGFYGMLAGIIGDVNKRTGVTQFMFPFVRIISNLMNNSLDYTPLGLMRANNASLSNMILGESKYAFDPMVKGSPEQIALASKSLLGTVMATTITALFLKELKDEEETGKKPNFMFYGTGPKDPAKRGEWMASGARPNTLKVGDTYFPYKAIPGVDLLGTMLGTMHDYLAYENPLPKLPHGQQYTKEQLAEHNNFFSGDKVYRMAIGIAMSPLEHHFLSGAKNLIDVLHDPQGKGAPKAMINQAVGTASQFTNPSILRTVRGVLGGIKSFGGTPEGNSPMLDTYNSMDGKMAQFVPFYMGFNQPSLNVLGDPITKRPTDALTDRWLFSSTTPPDPIISPLVNNGLFIPGPKKSASVMIDDKGTLKTLNDAGDQAWRAYVIARGDFLKQVLTPSMVDQLTKMDRLQAQSILDGPGVNSAASHYAKSVVEDMIFKKKIKLNG
jgi:hypothetical protein